MIEFFLGGARSGKSKLAEQAAMNSGLPVIYVATAQDYATSPVQDCSQQSVQDCSQNPAQGSSKKTAQGCSQKTHRALAEEAVTTKVAAESERGISEMQQRILTHRARRPASWQLIEEPFDLGKVIDQLDQPCCLLVDCLTLWLTNCLLHPEDGFYQQQKQYLLAQLQQVLMNNTTATATGEGKHHLIFVSNETNMGVVPMPALSRRFCDEAGLLHQDIASISEKVTLSVAGLPHVLKDSKY